MCICVCVCVCMCVCAYMCVCAHMLCACVCVCVCVCICVCAYVYCVCERSVHYSSLTFEFRGSHGSSHYYMQGSVPHKLLPVWGDNYMTPHSVWSDNYMTPHNTTRGGHPICVDTSSLPCTEHDPGGHAVWQWISNDGDVMVHDDRRRRRCDALQPVTRYHAHTHSSDHIQTVSGLWETWWGPKSVATGMYSLRCTSRWHIKVWGLNISQEMIQVGQHHSGMTHRFRT